MLHPQDPGNGSSRAHPPGREEHAAQRKSRCVQTGMLSVPSTAWHLRTDPGLTSNVRGNPDIRSQQCRVFRFLSPPSVITVRMAFVLDYCVLLHVGSSLLEVKFQSFLF